MLNVWLCDCVHLSLYLSTESLQRGVSNQGKRAHRARSQNANHLMCVGQKLIWSEQGGEQEQEW